MDVRSALRQNLTEEAQAYGYTLSIWGSGALLMTETQITDIAILAFVTGGAAGFGILAAAAFRSLTKKFQKSEKRELLGVSVIHVLASLGAVIINFGIIATTKQWISVALLAFLTGVTATAAYNILLLVEHYLYEDIYKIERGRKGSES